MKPGDWVTFEGAGQVLEVYEDDYNRGAGYSVKGVLVKVILSDQPCHNFLVRVPMVCTWSAGQRDKIAKGGQ